jgi:hypothetical protein
MIIDGDIYPLQGEPPVATMKGWGIVSGGASGGVLSSASDDDSGGSTARCASSH